MKVLEDTFDKRERSNLRSDTIMPQVIEWTNAGPDAIIYRYPNEDITWGAQLIVHEYEMAVFFRDGKAYDVFGPGRHTLTTLNLPLLTSLLTRIAGFGGNKPFKATVLYISTKVFNGKWGTRAQTTELAPLQSIRAIPIQNRRRITIR